MLIGEQDVASLDDDALSDLRARTIGFIFQTFNLIPVLSALENVEFPLLFRGGGPRRPRARPGARWKRSGCATSRATGRTSCRAASASAWRSRARWSPIRRWSWPTSPPPTWTRATGETIIDLMLDINRRAGTTFIFSTHDPRVMAHAQRVVRLADGLVVDAT